MIRSALLMMVAVFATHSVHAQRTAPPASPPSTEAQRIPPVGKSAAMWSADPTIARAAMAPRRFVTKRHGTFAGKRMNYAVVAEDIVLTDTLGDPTGSIFSFSYLAERSGSPAERPVMFIFNGGPGSSSVWLHMGLLGPRTPAYRDVTPSQKPPFRLGDNPHSVLAVADLVFIDPVGTGWSRYWGKGCPSDFYGNEADAAATVQFIERWLRKHRRWGSPKFVLGESYGTNRAALLSRRLLGGFLDGTLKGLTLNGVVLVGGDGGLATPKGNDRFLTGFTTQAATAWHHRKADRAGRDFDAFIADADRFARTELVPAIDAGSGIDPARKRTVAETHARFSGLPADFILSRDLKVTQGDFATRLLADQGLVIGTYDTRYTLPAANSLGDPVADDPAMGQYTAVFAGALNTYLRDELGIEIDEDYVLIDWVNVNMRWDRQTEADSGADLAAAMRRNPDLQLLSTQGWFDLFGAVGSAQYGIAARGLSSDRVTQKAYYSGHMPYVGEEGRRMADDLKNFIVQASRPS
jgi:carboxypeptidase C (cathepsin A)